MTPEQIARVVHEANRAVQIETGDPVVSPHWDSAPDWQRESAIDGVHNALDGATPEESHQNWSEYRLAQGWVYGPVKDELNRTHPCLIPYDQLPPEQLIKDALFVAIVGALRDPEES